MQGIDSGRAAGPDGAIDPPGGEVMAAPADPAELAKLDMIALLSSASAALGQARARLPTANSVRNAYAIAAEGLGRSPKHGRAVACKIKVIRAKERATARKAAKAGRKKGAKPKAVARAASSDSRQSTGALVSKGVCHWLPKPGGCPFVSKPGGRKCSHTGPKAEILIAKRLRDQASGAKQRNPTTELRRARLPQSFPEPRITGTVPKARAGLGFGFIKVTAKAGAYERFAHFSASRAGTRCGPAPRSLSSWARAATAGRWRRESEGAWPSHATWPPGRERPNGRPPPIGIKGRGTNEPARVGRRNTGDASVIRGADVVARLARGRFV